MPRKPKNPFPTPKAIPPRSAFRDWLQKKRMDDPVGTPGNPCGCPLALWLDSLGFEHASVGTATINVPPAGRKRKWLKLMMPLWAAHFIAAVDRLYDRTFPYRPVTAGQAIRVLDECAEAERKRHD